MSLPQYARQEKSSLPRDLSFFLPHSLIGKKRFHFLWDSTWNRGETCRISLPSERQTMLLMTGIGLTAGQKLSPQADFPDGDFFSPRHKHVTHALPEEASLPCLRADGMNSKKHGTSRPVLLFLHQSLHSTLCHHGIGHLQEARNIGACHIIALCGIFLCRSIHLGKDTVHDSLEALVHLFKCP